MRISASDVGSVREYAPAEYGKWWRMYSTIVLLKNPPSFPFFFASANLPECGNGGDKFLFGEKYQLLFPSLVRPSVNT
jgi:hypothetical protein